MPHIRPLNRVRGAAHLCDADTSAPSSGLARRAPAPPTRFPGALLTADARSFLHDLLSTPGVSGYEVPVQKVVRAYAGSFADEIRTDLHGNVILSAEAGDGPRIMFAGHCDQLGLLVSHIDDEGFLFVQTVGGWDPQQLVGQRVTVWADTGPTFGVISRKAIHLMDDAERKQVAELKSLWVDIGAKDKNDAEEVVSIGDPITVQLGIQEMRNRAINAPGLDNRTGVWVVVEGFRRAVERGLSASLFCASTVQEEIGLRGARTSAFGIDPQVAIAVDVTHATDCPGVDKRQRGSVELGRGPVLSRGANVNPVVWQRLRDEAEAGGLPYQVAALGRAAANDANPLQVSRAGVATGLVQIPNRYMHSPVEVVSWDDLEAAAELLARFACSVSTEDDFVPR